MRNFTVSVVCNISSFRRVAWYVMHLCHCRTNSLFLDLVGLWVQQLLGLVHVHEEVLQQPLGLRQAVCVHLLVDQR